MPHKRRQEILNLLKNAENPIKGGELSENLGVSRQVIVQDIALLRAQGEAIVATPQGYFSIKDSLEKKVVKIFACQHNLLGMKKELEIIVAKGGKVLDVIVEHPLYGELRGNLMLQSLDDIEQFVSDLNSSGAEPLSALTKGVHLHTVEASSKEIIVKIEKELQKENLLV